MTMEGINGQRPIPDAPSREPPGGSDRSAPREANPERTDSDPSRRSSRTGTRESSPGRSGVDPSSRELPEAPPDDIDPHIWQALDPEERRHFAAADGLEGPLTYGPGGPDGDGETDAGPRRGLHIDVRA